MDINRLDYERKRRNKSLEEMLEAIGISRSAYYRKCRGETQFTLKEIKDIMIFLDLDNPAPIFFTD